MSQYAAQAATGELGPSFAPASAGAGPRGLAADLWSRHLYCTGSLTGDVTTFFEAGGSLLYYGAQQVASDFWEYDGADWVELPPSGIPYRLGPAIAEDPVRQVVVLFGGGFRDYQEPYRDDTWE